MGCDLVVALGPATVDGQTIFAQNLAYPAAAGRCLCQDRGREFAPGEKVYTQYLELPQVRETCGVLAWKPDAWWGYAHGVNELGVAAGCATVRTHLPCPDRGLTGGDLVRLALERSHHARHALDLVTALTERYGQSAPPGDGSLEGADNSFLIADRTEAFALETAGRHWVCQEIRQVRAASNVCLIRQDWDHISAGLAEHAIAQGWWPADGCKLDFAGTLAEDPTGQASGLRRWGRSTLLLEQQSRHIDAAFLRRLLSDHYEGTHFEVDPREPDQGPTPLCQHARGPDHVGTVASTIIPLATNPQQPLVVWHSFGPPCEHLYFPLFLGADLPVPCLAGNRQGAGCGFWRALGGFNERMRCERADEECSRDTLAGLQARFDVEATELVAEGPTSQGQDHHAEWLRRAATLMQRHIEMFEASLEPALATAAPAANPNDLVAYY